MIIYLSIVKCVHPLNLPMIDESVRASLETDPPLMETNATFSCLPGLVFRGPYMSTCMENGEWEPDPRKAECLGKHTSIITECACALCFDLHSVDCNPPSLPSNGIIYPYTSTIEGAVVNFVCQKSALDLEENVSLAVCNKHGKWDPNPAEFCASEGTVCPLLYIPMGSMIYSQK